MTEHEPVHLANPPRGAGSVPGRSSGDIIPTRYVVMKHSQRCSTCNRLHESNDLYMQMNLAPRFSKGKHITNLVPLSTAPQYRLPIEVRTLATKLIPFCSHCVASDGGNDLLAGLPTPPPAKPLTIVPSWAGTGVHPDHPKAPKAPASQPAAKKDKLADLLAQI